MLAPQCCSWFDYLEDWDDSLDQPEASSFTIYIGHPWLDCLRRGDWLECDLNEYGGRPFCLSLAQLPAALDTARSMLETFHHRLGAAALALFGHRRLADLAARKLISYPEVEQEELDCIEIVAFFRLDRLELADLAKALQSLSQHSLALADKPQALYAPEPTRNLSGTLEELWAELHHGQMLLRLDSERPVYEIESDRDNSQLSLRVKLDEMEELDRFWKVATAVGCPFGLAQPHSA